MNITVNVNYGFNLLTKLASTSISWRPSSLTSRKLHHLFTQYINTRTIHMCIHTCALAVTTSQNSQQALQYQYFITSPPDPSLSARFGGFLCRFSTSFCSSTSYLLPLFPLLQIFVLHTTSSFNTSIWPS